MNLENKKVGIWGFGAVGKSVANYILDKFSQNLQQAPHLELLENRALTPTEVAFLQTHNITYTTYQKESKKPQNTVKDIPQHFLTQNDIIIPSPGIDLRPYTQYSHTFISELDLFAQEFTGYTIAITGSVGKTSVTHLLSQILNAAYQTRLTSQHKEKSDKIFTGGNIGTPALEIFKPKDNKKYSSAILELSSFQLELAAIHKNFSPDLAIWTNFYPNHLDRHGTLENYFAAKKNILLHQKPHQKAIVPLSIIDKLAPLDQIQSGLHFFTEDISNPQNTHKLTLLRPQDTLFYLDEEYIYKTKHMAYDANNTHNIDSPHSVGITHRIANAQSTDSTQNTVHALKKSAQKICSIHAIENLAHITFQENILLILSTLYLVDRTILLSEANSKNTLLKNLCCDTHTPQNLEHRLEKFTTFNSVEFYNDSKSTTSASTLAAVKKLALQKKPILLFLGGISKGVDRAPLIQDLKKIDMLKHIITFGKEAQELGLQCKNADIPYSHFSNLEDATTQSFSIMSPNDLVLFSPSGASFDLFENYIARGNRFKEFVSHTVLERTDI